MRYFDTSFLLPVFISEEFTSSVERILGQQIPGETLVSEWTRVEFSSALARQVRMRTLDQAAASEIERDFEALVSDTFVTAAPTATDFDLARRFVRRYETGLRSGDALHLAIASNHGATAIYSLDRGLLRAAQLLGLPVGSVGGLS